MSFIRQQLGWERGSLEAGSSSTPFGGASKLSKIKRGVYRYLFRKLYIYECSLESPKDEEPYRLLKADEALLQTMRHNYPEEFSTRKYKLLFDRLASNTEECWLIYSEKLIAGYCHIAYENACNQRIGLLLKLAPNQVYFFDAYVFKAFRGQGFHKFSIARRKDVALRRGYDSALTMVDKGNVPSRRACISQGFVPTKTIWYFPLLKKNLVFKKRDLKKAKTVDK